MLRILTWNAATTGFDKLPDVSQDIPRPVNKRKLSFDKVLPSMAVKDAPVHPTVAPISQIPVIPVMPVVPVQPQPVVTQVPPSIPVAAPVEIKLSSAQIKTKEDGRLATMRQTISSQMNLEILVKHRELRLIDQEIAKAQIALEQLRRCSEIPFPATQSPCQQVSAGKGAAVRKSGKAAKSPAPWGVTDGPYTRHYAKWLLPDPHFDGGKHEAAHFPIVIPAHGHGTRGHHTDFAQLVGKTSRANRALQNGLPPGYAEPKQKPTGPMILKRKTDGKMVKLVCPDCHRLDFGSAQGFINHCRIGHQRNFASHDAAAEGCGQLLDGDETIPTPVETQLSTPVVSMPVTPIVTPFVTPLPTPVSTPAQPFFASGSVHPLVKSAHTTSKDVLTNPLIKGGASKLQKKRKLSTLTGATPHLTAFVQKYGMNVNVADAVHDARMRGESEEDSDDHIDIDSPLPTPSIGGRTLQGAGKKHCAKSTGLGKARKPSFVVQDDLNIETGDASRFNFMPLVPSPTNDSTQAPSLIDDDEEMEPGSPPSSDEVEDDVHVHVRDDEHFEESVLRGGELSTPTSTCAQSQQDLHVAASARPVSSKADRPYTFISEQPFIEEHDRKRRKID